MVHGRGYLKVSVTDKLGVGARDAYTLRNIDLGAVTFVKKQHHCHPQLHRYPTRGQCDLFFPRLLFLKLETMEMAKKNLQYVGMSPSPQSGLVALSSGCKLKRAKGADEDK